MNALMPIVVRSTVPPANNYQDYREELRFDFWYSCAYCSMSEAEAEGIGFAIDHFRPQTFGGLDLHVYGNLMWACVTCNRTKSGNWPSQAHLDHGFRFVNPEVDHPLSHYRLVGSNLEPLTNAGKYTIEILFLNRDVYQRIRDARRRLSESAEHIAHGLQALSKIRLDKLDVHYRRRFQNAMQKAKSQSALIQSHLDDKTIVRVLNHSPLLDPDPLKVEHAQQRREFLKSLDVMVVSGGKI